jgi:hypothetical protein
LLQSASDSIWQVIVGDLHATSLSDARPMLMQTMSLREVRNTYFSIESAPGKLVTAYTMPN